MSVLARSHTLTHTSVTDTRQLLHAQPTTVKPHKRWTTLGATVELLRDLGEPLEHGPSYNYGDGDAEVSELEEESGEEGVAETGYMDPHSTMCITRDEHCVSRRNALQAYRHGVGQRTIYLYGSGVNHVRNEVIVEQSLYSHSLINTFNILSKYT